MMSNVQRSTAIMPDAGRLQHLEPYLNAAAGQIVERAGGLTDGPKHPEVADRRPLGARLPLEDDDAQAALGQMIRMGQAENACAGDGDIVLRFHGVLPARWSAVVSAGRYVSRPGTANPGNLAASSHFRRATAAAKCGSRSKACASSAVNGPPCKRRLNCDAGDRSVR